MTSDTATFCRSANNGLFTRLRASVIWLVLWLVWIICVSNEATAQIPSASSVPEIPDAESIRLPADLDEVDFYLITVDVGDSIWDNFGHTALRVVDRNSDSDLVFNWGLFDTSGGNIQFASNFLRGILNYQLGVSPPGWEFGRYEREQRTIWQDHINLTNEQKATLYRRLAWNLREENIVYSYQYFFDNCTTRPRDYLNEALSGRLQEANRALSRNTFRDEVKAHYASVAAVAVSLDVLMNERIDRRMSQWEEMFLPARLRQELLSFPSDVMSNGQRLPLLDDSRTLLEFPSPESQPNGYHVIGAGLLAVVILLALSIKRVPMASFSSQSGFTLRMSISYRLMGLAGVLISLVSGIFGILMTVAWMKSGHLDLHHNLNLLLFWPLDIVGVIFAFRWLVRGRCCSMGETARNLVTVYLILHLLAVLAYIVMVLFGISEQDVGDLLLYVVPAMTVFSIIVLLAGFAAERRIRFS